LRLAVLIGVSEYNTQVNLPACKNDVMAMKEIIDSSKKYDDSLIIYSNTNSDEMKQQVSQFFDKHRIHKGEIKELFFYFSGHGSYQNDEFYYILSDYENNKLNRTTYKNSEIDSLIKSLNPELTIKIVDACESGIKYVKDNGENSIKKLLDKTVETFGNCYFMFSSQFNENSYADESISFFTKSFIHSILKHNADTIRYRDIIDYIADDFDNETTQQKPYYVIQATNTEIFCSFSEQAKLELSRKLSKYTDTNNSEPLDVHSLNKEVSLIEIIKNDAEKYCRDISEIQQVFKDISSQINQQAKEIGNLSDIFTNVIDFDTTLYSSIENIDKVAKFIGKDSSNLFVETNSEMRSVSVKFDNVASAISKLLGNQTKPKYTQEMHKVIVSYEITEDSIPYNYINFDLLPVYPNLVQYNCRLIFAFSKKKLLIFYSYNKYKETKWDIYEPGEINWIKSRELFFKDESDIKIQINKIIQGFKDFVEDSLNSHFNSNAEKLSLSSEKQPIQLSEEEK